MPIKSQPLQVAQVQSSEDILYGIEDEIEMNTIDAAIDIADTATRVTVDYVNKRREANRQQAIADAAAAEQAEKNAVVLGLTSAYGKIEQNQLNNIQDNENFLAGLEEAAQSATGSGIALSQYATQTQSLVDKHAQKPELYTKTMLEADLYRLQTEAYKTAPQHYQVINSVINQLSGKSVASGVLETQAKRQEDAQAVIRQKEKDYYELGVRLGVNASLWETDRAKFVQQFDQVASVHAKATAAKNHITFLRESHLMSDDMVRQNAPSLIMSANYTAQDMFQRHSGNERGLSAREFFAEAIKTGDPLMLENARQIMEEVQNEVGTSLRFSLRGASQSDIDAVVGSYEALGESDLELLSVGQFSDKIAANNKAVEDLYIGKSTYLPVMNAFRRSVGELNMRDTVLTQPVVKIMTDNLVRSVGGKPLIPLTDQDHVEGGPGYPTYPVNPLVTFGGGASPTSGAQTITPPSVLDTAAETNFQLQAQSSGDPDPKGTAQKTRAGLGTMLVEQGKDPSRNTPADNNLLLSQTFQLAGDALNQYNRVKAKEKGAKAPVPSQIRAVTEIVNTPNFQAAFNSMSEEDKAKARTVLGSLFEDDVRLMVTREFGMSVDKYLRKGLTGSVVPVLGESPMTQEQTITMFGPGAFEEMKSFSEASGGLGFIIPSIGAYATVNQIADVVVGPKGFELKLKEGLGMTPQEEDAANTMLTGLTGKFAGRMNQIAGAYEFVLGDTNARQVLANKLNDPERQ